MGTRNLTMVVLNNETKVAQYGQWDGYPSGQGVTVLEFLKGINLEVFKNRLNAVRFETQADIKEKDEYAKEIGSNDGWMTMEQSALFKKKFPFSDRDLGAAILQEIMKIEEDEIVLRDSTDFAADSLFCEWAYVIDLDKGKLEVYTGFNKAPLTEGDRFYNLQIEDKEDKYFPIKLLKSFNINNLPTEDDFIKECEPIEEEEPED